MEKIQTFSPVYDVDTCLKGIRDCLESGWTGTGNKTIEVEEVWKNMFGFSNAHFLGNATAGLNLSLRIMKEQLGWDDECEVITTPITFIATNNAILYAKLTPVFADVDDTLCLDPEDVRKKITDKTRAIMFVGLGGNAGNYMEIAKICKENGLRLILDAAHMAGTTQFDKTVGLDADAVIYSFNVTKNISAADGGMLCFANKTYDEIARKMSWNGVDRTSSPPKYGKHYRWKINIPYAVDAYNGNSIMAAIVLAQLPHLEEENEKRRRMAMKYRALLKENKKITFVSKPEGLRSSQWLFQILVEDRDNLMQYLEDRGIICALHYLDNTEYPMFEKYHGNCPHAEYVSDHAISLPMNLRMEDKDVEYVAEKVLEYI